MVAIPAPSTPSARAECGTSSGPTNADLVLDNAAVILSALRKIGSGSSVPFLREAATVALRLVNLIKDVRDNSDAFRLLGLDAGKLVWTIATECERLAHTGKAIPVSVQEHINGLVTNLHSIEKFIEGKMVRRKLQKIIAASSDKLEVSRYREVLRTALDSFAIQASIASQEALHHISETINEQRVEVIFDRIHQTDTLNRLMGQQAEQMEQLRLTMISRYAEEDRLREEKEYHARVEREQYDSKMALQAEQEMQAAEDRLRREQEKEAETALRKKAAEKLVQMDRKDAEKLEAKKRREQAKEERETREAIAIVQLRLEEDELEAERKKSQEAARRRRKRQEEQERQRQQDEEEELAANKAAAAAARREARIAAKEAEDAKEEARRRQQRKAEKQRRDEEDEHDEPPHRRPGLGKGTHITATQVEITLTRKKKSNTNQKAKKVTADAEDTVREYEEAARELERKLERRFEGFEDGFLDSDDQEYYWSDDAPRKSRAKTKKATKAVAIAGRARSYVDVDALRIQDMAMQHVNAYAGAHSPYYPPYHASPYMMPPPGPYGYDYPPSYAASSSHANATSISVRNVSNSAISFGDSPAVVRNSGNISVVNISNVGNRY
ncbi:hypothetical protein D9619_002388 [Psilocybe cf. subviscida]|uniref:Uncharacterized protein n=1 Tax=Psilocybe cf. subviscida TaxID=2480587 RepID=A0A8H5EUT6_9AGAR|nr:hypothetical protein D9619_002388 [Psilocybe cf. subviscida]